MTPNQVLRTIAFAVGMGYVLSAASALSAKPIIDPTKRRLEVAAVPGQTTQDQATGVRQIKTDTAPEVQPLERLATRVENRIRNRIQNRVDRDYDPKADPAASYTEAAQRTRAVAPARRRR